MMRMPFNIERFRNVKPRAHLSVKYGLCLRLGDYGLFVNWRGFR